MTTLGMTTLGMTTLGMASLGKNTRLALLGLAAAGALCGCSGAESPQANARDVAAARDYAAAEEADANRRAARRLGAAVEQVQRSKYDVELAQADGNHQIAVQKCEVLAGAQRKACVAQADADYEMLKSIAKTQYPDLASAR
jgi:hypothetical protein